MLKHYLAVAVAQLAKSPLYAVLSIGGLGLGLAACTLIALFVRHETSYDSELPGLDRLYRVHVVASIPGRPTIASVLTQGPLAPAIEHDISEVERVAWFSPTPVAVKLGSTSIADELALTGDGLFDVLDLPAVRGDRNKIFTEPGTVLVTETAARKYFGSTEPMGATLRVCCFAHKDLDLRVVGILRDISEASHLKLTMVTNLRPGVDPDTDRQMTDWLSVGTYTYVKLRPNATAEQVNARLAAVIKSHVPPLHLGDKLVNAADLLALHVRRVSDLHLAAAADAGTIPDMKPSGDPTTVATLAVVGVILLLISITNFVNMATARAGRRAREIAVRKVLGASPRDIIFQYLGEAVVIAVGALVCALGVVELGLPWFRDVMQRPLPDPFTPADLAILLAATVSVGLLAGAYPAFVLSRFQPAAVMKANQTSVAGGSGRLRKVLVFSQFLAAVALVASTAVIVHQAQFAASAQLGYDKRDKLVVKDISSDRVANAVRDELIAAVKRIPSVRSSAISDIVPTSPIGGNVLIDSPGDTGDQIMIIGVAHISHEFFSLYGIAAQAGRTFDLARGDDAEAPHMVINASAVRRIGFRSAEDAVGRTVRVHLSETLASEIQIVGVVPDVHFTSARFPVAPMVFLLDTTRARRLTIGFAPGSGPSVLRDVQATWAQIAPEVPFEADFLDALVDEQSRDERLLGIGLAGAGLLALIVAFAGLYGLSSFVTESRMREVAIRKVLGARDRDILGQLLWQTIQPILLACAVALPAAYFLMTRWLERFAYHIELGPGIFAVTGIAALTIAVATITGQTVGAARRRPVDTLRRD